MRETEPSRAVRFPLLLDMLEISPTPRSGRGSRASLPGRRPHVCPVGGPIGSAPRRSPREGQVKSQDRHEKDDRRRIDDRTQYVLGWTNQPKVDALVADAERIQRAGAPLRRAIEDLRAGRSTAVKVQGYLVALQPTDKWSNLDWQSIVKEIDDLEDEAARIRGSSDVLRTLAGKLEQVTSKLKELSERSTELAKRQGELDAAKEGRGRSIDRLSRLLDDTAALEAAAQSFAELADLVPATDRTKLNAPDTVVEAEQATRDAIRAEIKKASDEQSRVARRAEGDMQRFRTAFPQEVAELDDSIESAPEYSALHDRVANDDLPRFEAEFRRSLARMRSTKSPASPQRSTARAHHP